MTSGAVTSVDDQETETSANDNSHKEDDNSVNAKNAKEKKTFKLTLQQMLLIQKTLTQKNLEHQI